jgi:fatty acid desaturase
MKRDDRQRTSFIVDGPVQSQSDLEPPSDIFHDPRLRAVGWRDLVGVTSFEILLEPLLPAMWLAVSLLAAAYGHYVIALGLSFVFFLTGLRFIHNAFHSSLGLSRRATNIVLWVMSLVMLGSMHAVQFNHLRHHRLTLSEDDVEGRHAEMPAWRALLFGPAFPILLHITALRYGNRKLRATVSIELLLNVAWIALIFLVWNSSTLRYHVSAMAVGQCLTAFFAVWTVHHHCDRTHYIARTLRNKIKNAITFNMFLHIEHHLFPRVPTCHLPELSRRIDRVAPELRSRSVF